jgi:hypothetical protein
MLGVYNLFGSRILAFRSCYLQKHSVSNTPVDPSDISLKLLKQTALLGKCHCVDVTATVAMVTLSQGAAAAMVILNTAVAVAQNSVAAAQNALGVRNLSFGNYTLLGNSTGAKLFPLVSTFSILTRMLVHQS